jgi:hypothetical protein
VERANASGTRPEPPQDYKGRSAGRVLGALQIALNNRLHAERPEGEAWAFTRFIIFFSLLMIKIPDCANIKNYYISTSNVINLDIRYIISRYPDNQN